MRSDEEMIEENKNEDETHGYLTIDEVEGKYECLRFVFSEKVEKRIYKPWRMTLIVKLLGIGFKALETRLQQMWAKDGIINLVGIGNNFYLVKFSSKQDLDHALVEGPWMIYDHYLTIRSWAPCFEYYEQCLRYMGKWERP